MLRLLVALLLLFRVKSSNSSLTGDSQCVSFMCVTAIKNGTTVEYALQSRGAAKLGWMAMGFGTVMANSPMVIMWANSGGNITLSQRRSSGHSMPKLVSNSPFQATLQQSQSLVSGNSARFVYTTPDNSSTIQNVIWAFGATNPGNSVADASLAQHLSAGTFKLNLTKAFTNGTLPPLSDAPPRSIPFVTYQKLIIVHAIFVSFGFLLLLPLGALLARWLRTYWPGWFRAHWIVQLALSLPVIVVGVGLGIASVANMQGQHLNDSHKRWGVAIFALYIAQCALGAYIHFVKPRQYIARPPQNYIHAVLGLIIIGLAFYEVHSGYDDEWPEMIGRGDVPQAVNVVWIILLVLLPLLYFAGLSLLPRQRRLEATEQAVPLRSRGSDESVE